MVTHGTQKVKIGEKILNGNKEHYLQSTKLDAQSFK